MNVSDIEEEYVRRANLEYGFDTVCKTYRNDVSYFSNWAESSKAANIM